MAVKEMAEQPHGRKGETSSRSCAIEGSSAAAVLQSNLVMVPEARGIVAL